MYKRAIFLSLLFILVIFIVEYYGMKPKIEKFTNSYEIPVVVICWNNYFFVKNFVNQLKRYKNPIILLDNNSNYQPLLDYYKDIKKELGERIEIRLLEENYGHLVYMTLKDTLPDIYILSDPDLELNQNMPENFAEILLNISNSHKIYKVGAALSLDDADDFIPCANYNHGKNIRDWESKFWTNRISNDEYELYSADTDTTFCLVNNNYYSGNEYDSIRISGNFKVRHLPWYNDYIKKNISQDEIDNWKKNNKSSSILFTCLQI